MRWRSNPQPCGFFNDKSRECHCSPQVIQRYVSKISGPLMDRIDIQIDVPAVPYKELSNTRGAESSETIRHRVVTARNVQLRRFFDEHIYTNAQMGPRHLRKYCVLTPDCEKIVGNAVTVICMNRRQFFLGLIFQEKPITLQVEVMEVFSSSDGPAGFLVHHASEATRNVFAAWIRANSGAAVVCRLRGGTQIEGRIFRVSMCFGRGLILTTAPTPIQIRPRDVLIIELR